MRLLALGVGAAVLAVSVLVLVPSASAQEEILLRVGDLGELRSRNALVVLLRPTLDDGKGLGILGPVFSSALLVDERGLQGYLAKGVDVFEDGAFTSFDYNSFFKAPGTRQTEVDVYFDFNGALWHDGTQVDEMDVLFSLLMASFSPAWNPDLRVLWDRADRPEDFPIARSLAVDRLWCGPTDAQWVGASGIPGDNGLRCALRFRLQFPFPQFYERTLGGVWILPRHVWEGTGDGRHPDFGTALYPRGDPRAGQPVPSNETAYTPFDFPAAERWLPTDADVVGSGPFEFLEWIPGSHTRLGRNPMYYAGRDPMDPGTVFDPVLAARVHPPLVDGIEFRPYPNAYSLVGAILRNEIDYVRANLPLEWVPDLIDSDIRVWVGADLGFVYLGYNLRFPPFGYSAYPPTSPGDDTGRTFRRAFAHLFDKQSIVRVLLQNYGVLADSPISPANTFWYNGSLPWFGYNPSAAATTFDNAGWLDTDGDGWREFPRIGDSSIELLAPHADYDPLRASAGAMVAAAARSVGVNVGSRPTAQGEIIRRAEIRNYDLSILSRAVDSEDPDFLFGMFHSSTGGVGENYGGYWDGEFDEVINRSRREMDRGIRQWLVQWAQGILAEDRPIEPLYFRTAFQGTRPDTFTNWTWKHGSLWNYWTWIGVRPVPVPIALRLVLSHDTAMAGGTTQPIEALVSDATGAPLEGAGVQFRVLTTDGGRFVESSGTGFLATTPASGRVTATYEAPVVPTGFRDIVIEILADHPRATSPAQRIAQITVFPATIPFLRIRTTLPSGDLTIPGAPLPLRIEIRDEGGFPVVDADVRAVVMPENATVSPSNGTAAEMARPLFTPPEDLRANLSFRVSLQASKTGYQPSFANLSLFVLYLPEASVPPPETDGNSIPWLPIAVGGTVVVIIAGLSTAGLLLRRRRAT